MDPRHILGHILAPGHKVEDEQIRLSAKQGGSGLATQGGTLLGELLTEERNPASLHISELPLERVLEIFNEEDRKVAFAVGAEIPRIAQAVEAIIAAARKGGRLFYIGAGSSGRLGVLDAAECPPTFGVPEDFVQGIMAGGEAALAHAAESNEDDPAAGRRDLLARGFRSSDVLVGIAASGRTPYVLGALEAAAGLGAVTIGISCTPNSEVAKRVSISIAPLTGPEVIAGSTRLKAGTAAKLILNMMSSAVMIRMGYVYGNLMINVQPKNAKLRDRAERIVSEAAGISRERARELLGLAGDKVPAAIVMARLGVDRANAEARLNAAGGNISEALVY